MVEKKSPTAGLASQEFDAFCAATTLKTILGHHRNLCELLHLKPSAFPQFYPKLKSKLSSWKAKALWAKFDKRAAHKCYNRGKACPNTKLLIIGGGPCGLRTAIEAQLLGAKVVVLEKRDRISRHNVLHLWPFVIHDLKALNAKKFFGKFCAGAIDHISIRQLQYILLKVALILGVEFHEGVCFDSLIPPPEDQNVEKNGWRAKVTPADHPVSQYEFDVLIGADGKRNTLEGFKRKEFRGKLAIAITANFINRRTEAEARVEEISGVAFIFNQKFFKDLYAETGIDLENIVYYKDETHYFVMTAKKHSLISSGVILNDYPDTIKLLSPENKDQDALMKYARDAAEFSTNYIMQNLEFAVDHYGQPDVAMFDFTSMFAAENASRVVERHGYKLLQMLVGDSLLEPFWPTGSGCARGFLSSMDACWAIKNWGSGQANVLEVLAERESIYRILGQTTPENLQRDYAAYTLDPHSRYPNLNKQSVNPIQVKQLFDTDDPAGVELPQIVTSQDTPKKRRRKDSEYVQESVASIVNKMRSLSDTNVHIPNPSDLPSRYPTSCRSVCNFKTRSRNHLNLKPGPTSAYVYLPEADISLILPKDPNCKDSQVHPDTLLHWLKKQIALYDRDVVHIENVTSSFKNGLVLCAIIHRYRPDLIEFQVLKPEDVAKNNQLAFDILERELGVPPVMTGLEMEQCDIPDKLTMLAYLSQIYDTFRGEIPHIKHPKLEPETKEEPVDIHAQLRNLKPEHKVALLGRITGHAPRVTPSRKRVSNDAEPGATAHQRLGSVERKPEPVLRKPRKRRSQDKLSIEDEERLQRIEEIRKNRYERQLRRQYIRKLTTQQFFKSMQMLQTNARQTDDTPFEDYSLFVYRQTAPNFTDRIKEMERKILYPDREARIQEEIRKGANPDENLFDRVKLIEEKLRGKGPAPDKKPKDLNRAIGKIERSDWNVKEIEKKIQENKMGRGKRTDRGEKVPKWSREQFDDKFQAMKTKLQRKSMDKEKDKYADIDVSLKRLDRKIKEGSVLDMGQRGANKVSALAEQLAYKTQEPEKPAIQKSSSKAALVLPSQGGSEACHFCNKRVYLMERLSAEGKFFHRGCFRCEYCSTTLRLGNYAFDRDGRHGSRFFCIQHFGQQTTTAAAGGPKVKARRKSEELRMELGKENVPTKTKAPTPKSVERVRARSLVSTLLGKVEADGVENREKEDAVDVAEMDAEMSDEDGHSEMDEDEWTDVNFGASAAEGSSDSVSDMSDSEEEAAAEALEAALEPPEMNADETRRLAEKWTKRHSGGAARPVDKVDKTPNNEEDDEEEEDDDSESYDDDASDDGSEAGSDYDSDDDESDTATEGEEEIRAREQRRLEVPLDKLKGNRSTDSGSDTEIATDEETSESESEEENSATEISTDSEFEHDGTTPTQHEIPAILIDDVNVPYRRRMHDEPKKVQVRTGHVIRPVNGTVGKPPVPRQAGVKLEFKNLRPVNEPVKSSSLTNLTAGINNINNKNIKLTTVVVPTPLINPNRGDYLLNRTLSTEGIASKLSLELKKKYLLGPSGLSGSVKKSGSASTIDSTFKSVVDVISEQQKLLKPAAELSPSMQAFLQGTSQVRPYDGASPVSPTPVAAPFEHRAPFEHVCARREHEDVVRPLPTPPPIVVASHPAPAASVDRTAPEPDCRPRSPVHETSIVVPDIPWASRRDDDDDMDSDSLSSESSSESDDADVDADEAAPPPVRERTPPRVEVHDSSGERIVGEDVALPAKPTAIDLFGCRSAALKPTSIELFTDRAAPSEKSSPSSPPSLRGSEHAEATLALTETEWSDWAHDADVAASDDLDDAEFNVNPAFVTQRRRKAKVRRATARMARGEDFTDPDEFPAHVCGRRDPPVEAWRDNGPLNATQRLLSVDAAADAIEFMDTSDEDDADADGFVAATNATLLRNNGYVQFVDEATPVNDAPRGVVLLSEVGETSDGPDLASLDAVNRTACSADDDSIPPDNNSFLLSGDSFLPENDLFQLSGDSMQTDNDSFQPDNDSLPPEAADDTTTSDLVTVKDSPLEQLDTSLGDPFYETPRLENGSREYDDYVQRLAGRISPFGNVRDSIDVRRARKPVPKAAPSARGVILEDEAPVVAGDGISARLEEISRDRSKQKDLVREMVMGKLSTQRRSQERKGKRSIARSPLGAAQFSPCGHGDVGNNGNRDVDNGSSPSDARPVQLPVIKSYTDQQASLPTTRATEPDEGTPTAEMDRDDVFYTPLTSFKKLPDRPLSVHSSFRGQRPAKLVPRPGLLPDTPLTNPEAFSCPDIRHALFKSPDDPFKTPIAPPRARNDDRRTVDREQARIRARLKSDEELGLSPEDYIKSLKQKVLTRSNSRPESIASLRTLQTSEGGDVFAKNTTTNPLFVDSETVAPGAEDTVERVGARSNPGSPVSAPAILTPGGSRERIKSKDSERRKSGIIQAVSDFFHKKKESSRSPSPNKEKFSRFKFNKAKGKSAYISSDESDQEKLSPRKEKAVGTPTRGGLFDRRPVSAHMDLSPPPIPPPPSNYLGNGSAPKLSAEDSLSEHEDDSRATAPTTPSHCAGSSAEVNGSSKRSRNNQRMARQVQLKRHRMAQEIQRQLEELDVKQRELERRGVAVEKALRGEGEAGDSQEEEELLREWFNLMREQSELRRYERELLMRAEELELEDRHTRLQQELRDKMSRDDANKTSEDVVKEGQILAEMLDIVERKDSLVSRLEEDRLRYQEEDRDLEAQMVAKGLRVTPRQVSHV